MQYVRLGFSELKVSRISLDIMSFGDPKLQAHSIGQVVGKEEANKVLKRA
ncbi:MAG: hypothetical protein ACP5I6_06295 [Caldisphaera sp.]|jgi:aryl-alcohol dehydrogenase-like predicted oxidoreductase|nr:hypothetical protein [Caldisphaera sp.]